MSSTLGDIPTPENIFYYIYAVFRRMKYSIYIIKDIFWCGNIT
ncbi:MAG: hypothetical protein ACKPER_24655 [Dolichospermum sp.]